MIYHHLPSPQAVEAGSQAISAMCLQMEDWAAAIGQKKRGDLLLPPAGLEEQIWGLVGAELQQVRCRATLRCLYFTAIDYVIRHSATQAA